MKSSKETFDSVARKLLHQELYFTKMAFPILKRFSKEASFLVSPTVDLTKNWLSVTIQSCYKRLDQKIW